MSHKRVLHVQRGFRMSMSYAEQVMRDHCSIAWVVKGATIRDTTDEERIQLRAEQAKQAQMREPLPYAEIFGLRYDPSARGISATRREGQLIWDATKFAMSAGGCL